jgi:superfamily II DNA/RNA helicase
VQSHILTALLDCIRRYKIDERDPEFVPQRIMVLVPSILGATQIERDLKHLTRKQQQDDEISVGLVTSETLEEEMKRVVEKCTIIVCTTILSSSVNIAKLDLILIYSTTYSMSDLVQAIGRVGRQGQKAKAILLFNNEKHEAIFGAKNTQQYFKNQMGPVMWAQKLAFDAGLAAVYSPAGVQSFAMSENQCRREYIGKLFGGPSSQVQSCLNDLQRNNIFCNVCRANIDEASQCLLTE